MIENNEFFMLGLREKIFEEGRRSVLEGPAPKLPEMVFNENGECEEYQIKQYYSFFTPEASCCWPCLFGVQVSENTFKETKQAERAANEHRQKLFEAWWEELKNG